MTEIERDLIAELEADMNSLETQARFFDTLVEHLSVSGGDATPGLEYARGLRERIEEHVALIEKLQDR